MKQVHSVTTEYTPPTKGDFFNAANAALRLRFAEAKTHLGGRQTVFACDAEGNKLFGIGGSVRSNITLYTQG